MSGFPEVVERWRKAAEVATKDTKLIDADLLLGMVENWNEGVYDTGRGIIGFGLAKDEAEAGEHLKKAAKHMEALLDRFKGSVMLSLAAYENSPSRVESLMRVPNYDSTQLFVSGTLTTMTRVGWKPKAWVAPPRPPKPEPPKDEPKGAVKKAAKAVATAVKGGKKDVGRSGVSGGSSGKNPAAKPDKADRGPTGRGGKSSE